MTAASVVTPRVVVGRRRRRRTDATDRPLQLLRRGLRRGGGPQDHPTDDPEADYEGLPRGASTSTHMMAGAVAGIMEHCLMFPIDCVKPDPAAHYRNVMDALRRIITTEGVWRPIRGLNATAGQLVVKQRMQMYNSPYRGVLDCVRAVWRREGGGAFYRSYTTQLTMNVPFQALHFITYEYLQELLNPRRQYNPSSHVVSGALAGALAAAATTPLDVCKTLLNTQESLVLGSLGGGHHPAPPPQQQSHAPHRQITGLAHAFRTVYRLGGMRGFFKGAQARVIYQMPSTAISWSVYEFFKYGITQHQHGRRLQQQHRGAEI
ncbi:hypothetical protein CRUP_001034 [Coryphaenoides rupestris]|nr:hypothetical protein CRUP_001034 [Coryphaenoides rupestris]